MEEAQLRVNTPAILLLVTGVVCLVLDLVNAGYTIFGLISPIIQVISTALQASQASGDDLAGALMGGGSRSGSAC